MPHDRPLGGPPQEIDRAANRAAATEFTAEVIATAVARAAADFEIQVVEPPRDLETPVSRFGAVVKTCAQCSRTFNGAEWHRLTFFGREALPRLVDLVIEVRCCTCGAQLEITRAARGTFSG